MTANPLTPFLNLRTSASREPIGDGGPDTCAALTAALDAGIAELGSGIGAGEAVVALGGYGRGEQCIWSDVDLMILHHKRETEPLVQSVFYPLWDANLKVGHAVRSVQECRMAGREDLETLTSLLSARLVVGDTELFAEFERALGEILRERALAPRLADLERERRVAEPYPVMAADLKGGRGALRTHEGFWWERRRAELIGLSYPEQTVEEREAKTVLLSIRNALHAVAGRPTDRFLVDLREPAAAWLDTDVQSLAVSLTSALHIGDRLADRRWPELHVEPESSAGLGRRVFGAIRTRFSTSEMQANGDASETVLAMAVRAAGRSRGAWFDPAEEDLIRAAPPTEWTAADRTAFVTLLSAGGRGRTIFGLLEELGWVEREFPEWIPVSTAPQLAPFHSHPSGSHMWRAVDEMQAIINAPGADQQMVDEIGSTEELLLAAFLHDIGKAQGGNHEIVGAHLAAAFLRRAGFGPSTVASVVNAVRHHLLLAETATRRDIADPAVIDEVASVIEDLRQLQLLYLLTVADLRATGSTMWNEWRSTLLGRLYRRVARALETGGAVRATPDIEAIVEAVDGRFDRRFIEEHVDAMPGDYLDTTSPREVAWHLDVVSALDIPGLVSVDAHTADRILVAGTDREGFLLAVGQAFTRNGIGVMDARLRTRSDGIALDTFHVADDRTGGAVAPERWERVADDLVSALSDEDSLRSAIAERIRAYRRHDEGQSPVEVRTDRSGRNTVIEVRAPDRIGLLLDIVEALHDEELDVRLAKIDTMGGQARDLFHVRRSGAPIRGETELAALRARIQERLHD
ncbi:MAG: HD domain-containing protein [Acidimicrobiia bacterium]